MNTQCRPAAPRPHRLASLALTLILTLSLTPTSSPRAQPLSPPPPGQDPTTSSPSPSPSPPPGEAVTPATDLPIDIVWSAPDGCPDVGALKSEVRRVAGEIPPSTVRPEARAIVRRGRAGGWQLSLTTKAGTAIGERRLTASECDELMRAAALVMALMLNPTAGVFDPPPPPPPVPPPVIAAPAPAPAPPRSIQLAAGVDLLAGTGTVPDAGAGFGLRLAAGGERLFGQLRGGYWLAREAFISDRPEAGGSFDAFDLGASGCFRFRPDRRVSPALCGGLLVIRSHGDGLGVSAPSEATAWWSAAGAEAQVRIRVGARQALRIGLEGVLPLGRPPIFALRGIGPVFQPAASGGRGTLGWEVYF